MCLEEDIKSCFQRWELIPGSLNCALQLSFSEKQNKKMIHFSLFWRVHWLAIIIYFVSIAASIIFAKPMRTMCDKFVLDATLKWIIKSSNSVCIWFQFLALACDTPFKWPLISHSVHTPSSAPPFLWPSARCPRGRPHRWRPCRWCPCRQSELRPSGRAQCKPFRSLWSRCGSMGRFGRPTSAEEVFMTVTCGGNSDRCSVVSSPPPWLQSQRSAGRIFHSLNCHWCLLRLIHDSACRPLL